MLNIGILNITIDTNIITNFFNIINTTLQYNLNLFYNNIEYIYITINTVYIFNLKILFLNSFIFSLFYSDSLFFFSLWFKNFKNENIQLFNSVFLDMYNILLFNNISFINNFFINNIWNIELLYSYSLYYKYNYFFNFSNGYLAYSRIFSYSFLLIFLLYLQLLFYFFLVIIFVCFFLSNFYFVNDNNLIHFLNFMLIESEKEIFSYEDMLLAIIIICYIFGSYFYIHCCFVSGFMVDLILIIYSFSWLYFLIFGIPTMLIYDFGLYFLCYLRGVGSSASLIAELGFDYIAVIIFYTRILVQYVRLVLILVTYIGMAETILYFSFDSLIYINNFFNTFNYINSNFSYNLIILIPTKLCYWIFELMHTFFVVTVQFIAFFVIVFWLFLFLYTFFVIERQEEYFKYKKINKC